MTVQNNLHLTLHLNLKASPAMATTIVNSQGVEQWESRQHGTIQNYSSATYQRLHNISVMKEL